MNVNDASTSYNRAYGANISGFFMKVQEKTTNHKLTLAVSFLVERVQKHDGLNGLSETHLIGENRVGFLTVIEPQPVDTLLHK